MNLRKGLWNVVVAGCGFVALGAAHAATIFGELDSNILATNGGRIVLLDKTGEELWSFRGENCHDIWKLDNGNILFADSTVKEVDPKTDEVVFSYVSKVDPKNGAFSCQRLANGHTVLSENSTGKILEVNKQGQVVFELNVEPFEEGNHHNLRMVRKLENGNYLLCFSGAKIVREYTPEGKIVFEVHPAKLAFSAMRLPNGNTLVGHVTGVTEYNPAGQVIWELTKADLKGFEIGKLCGVNVLPNNNLLIGVYGAKHTENGAGIFEVTRDKKVVWRYVNLGQKKGGNFLSAIKLGADGKMSSKIR
jgi:outer membrane protein assembly factor BamB